MMERMIFPGIISIGWGHSAFLLPVLEGRQQKSTLTLFLGRKLSIVSAIDIPIDTAARNGLQIRKIEYSDVDLIRCRTR
jgi:hypothetical protein